MHRLLVIAFAALTPVLLSHDANAASINLATNGTATASSSWYSATPDRAIDGDNLTGWNSGNVAWYSPQWIEINLGQASSIHHITGLVDQWPDGYTHHNIYLDGVLNFSWVGYTTYDNLLSHTFQTPVTAQLVKIETIASPSWVAWKEIQVLQEITPPADPEPVPEPIGILGLSTATGLGLFLGRRRVQ